MLFSLQVFGNNQTPRIDKCVAVERNFGLRNRP